MSDILALPVRRDVSKPRRNATPRLEVLQISKLFLADGDGAGNDVGSRTNGFVGADGDVDGPAVTMDALVVFWAIRVERLELFREGYESVGVPALGVPGVVVTCLG